ncbi:MAG: VanZ family protein [Thermoanaerobaculia bacterium]
MKTLVRDRFLALLWWAMTVVVLLLPGSEHPVGPEWLVRFAESGGDKLVHGILFFGLVVLSVRALRPLGRPRALGVSLTLAALWAPLSEWLQRTVPYRDASLLDLAADVVGLVLATVLVLRGPGPVEPA